MFEYKTIKPITAGSILINIRRKFNIIIWLIIESIENQIVVFAPN